MRKALFLTRHFPPLATGMASRAMKLVTGMPSIGWESIVVAPPSVAGIDTAMPAGIRIAEVHRTGPDIDPSKLDADGKAALLHGRPVPALLPLSARLSGIFKDDPDGPVWEKSAASLVENLLKEHPEIDLLYAQGPPFEPLNIALETARKHHLTVVLDIVAPLDPAMPAPGAKASSSHAEAEERILLSGVTMITPTRALKEYFLKKYHGRLDHGSMTIVPPAFINPDSKARHEETRSESGVRKWYDKSPEEDGSPTVSDREQEKSLTCFLLIDDLPKNEIKALVAGLDIWIRTDSIKPGDIRFALHGEGAPELLRRAAKSPLAALLLHEADGGMPCELDHCRTAGLFCAVLANSAPNTCHIPDRLIDALGTGTPICAISPDGPTAKLVLEAGGMTAPCGQSQAITELFRTMFNTARSHTVAAPPTTLLDRHTLSTAMQEFTRAIASQHVR